MRDRVDRQGMGAVVGVYLIQDPISIKTILLNHCHRPGFSGSVNSMEIAVERDRVRSATDFERSDDLMPFQIKNHQFGISLTAKSRLCSESIASPDGPSHGARAHCPITDRFPTSIAATKLMSSRFWKSKPLPESKAGNSGFPGSWMVPTVARFSGSIRVANFGSPCATWSGCSGRFSPGNLSALFPNKRRRGRTKRKWSWPGYRRGSDSVARWKDMGRESCFHWARNQDSVAKGI
jgi:hypothetical protein